VANPADACAINRLSSSMALPSGSRIVQWRGISCIWRSLGKSEKPLISTGLPISTGARAAIDTQRTFLRLANADGPCVRAAAAACQGSGWWTVALRRQRSHVRIVSGAPFAYKTTNISVLWGPAPADSPNLAVVAHQLLRVLYLEGGPCNPILGCPRIMADNGATLEIISCR
jgi:hypothetical protein